MDKLAVHHSIVWVKRHEERRKEEEDRWRQRSKQQQQKTHMPRLVSRSLTSAERQRRFVTIQACVVSPRSCLFVSSLLLGQANLRCSSSSVSTCDCFLLLSLCPSNYWFLGCSPHRSLYLDFSLCFCVTSLGCACVFLQNGCKDSRDIEIKWKDVYSSRCYLLVHFESSAIT